MIAPETLSKQIHLAKFLNASPFISTGIYLVIFGKEVAIKLLIFRGGQWPAEAQQSI